MVRPAAQPRYLKPGDKLGKYELIRQIAIGGMAELYLARTQGIEGFEKLVVVKRILPQFTENRGFVDMFLNEARLAATLHHPNIAQVYDIGVESGDYFFSMEYIHGEDLGRLVMTAVENGVPISLDVALTLIAGLCAGLHYAHEKIGQDGKPLNVVHRDVSPSNVLVTYDGAVKLVDFGIARANNTTSKPGLKGKISYMSPEQCRGKGAIDRRSDIYSIGTILYELTTGQLPFSAENEYGILNQIVNADPEPPSKVVPGYSSALEAIVMRAMSRDPLKRYRTALELQGALEDFAHENRLRVSPLVLTRLMSALFASRLEDWGEAKTQGAFFVEQHVVRTLIESGKTGEGETFPTAAAAAAAAEAQELSERSPDAITKATPIEMPADYDPPTSQVVSPPPAVAPNRPTPLPTTRQTPPAATPIEGFGGAREPIARPTPIPVGMRSPVPGSLRTPMPATAGTLVSSAMAGELTGRIQHVPAGEATTLVNARAPRNRMPALIVLGALGIAASFAGYMVYRGTNHPAAVTPIHEVPVATVPLVVPDPPAEAPKVEPVVVPIEPAAVAPLEPKIEPKTVVPLPPPPLTEKPPHLVAKPPPIAKASPVVVPKVKPKKPAKPDKPDPKEDPEWNPDSPLLPIRTGH